MTPSLGQRGDAVRGLARRRRAGARRAARARRRARRRADPGRQRGRRARARRGAGRARGLRALAVARAQRRRRARARATGCCSSTPTAGPTAGPDRALLRPADRRRRRRARGRGGRLDRRRIVRRPLRRRAQLPRPAARICPSVPAARGGGEPARAPARLRAGRRLLRGGARRRGHRLQLAPAARRLAARGPSAGARRAPVPDQRRALRRQWRGYAAGRAWLGAATRTSTPSRRCGGPAEGCAAPLGPPRVATVRLGARSYVRPPRPRAAFWRSTRCSASRSWPASRSRTGRRPRTAAGGPVQVVLVAEHFPTAVTR